MIDVLSFRPPLRALRMMIASVASLCAIASPASAQVRGEILGPGATRLPVAVVDLRIMPGAPAGIAEEFTRTLRGDLEHSGLFRVVNPAAYIGDPQSMSIALESINFDNWRSIGAMGLALGQLDATPEGIAIEMRYFDVANRAMVGGRRLVGPTTDAIRMGHRMADAIMEFLTGTPGPFESRIAFISDRAGRFREVFSYTFDGAVRQLTRHNSITMSPSWHPSGRAILLTSFKEGRPMLFGLDIVTGYDTRIAAKMGVNVGASYSPDGRRILLAREEGGNTDLYELDPNAGSARRLTTHWGIDVAGTYSPDGRRIAMCSSRSGAPQIYTMTPGNEGGAQRLTFEGDYNCSPKWSPDGRYIAFAGRRQGSFQIFVVPAAGGAPRQLTFAGSNEDPTWSPDSRYIAFTSRRGGRKKIYMTDLQGRWERQLTDGNGNDSSPSWSRRLN
jgi:TolB protein